MKVTQSPRPASGAAASESRQLKAGGCYVAPAPLKAVLIEQLEFLIAHAGEECRPGCVTCGRLSRVLAPLLEPFRA